MELSGYSGDNGTATNAELCLPFRLAISSNGILFIADSYNHVIRKVDTAGIITTIAGTGTLGFSGDGGLAVGAKLNTPYALALDSGQNIFLTDTNNHRIRKVNSLTGVITTVAGNGIMGYSGDGGNATLANLNYPKGIAVDSDENIYFADTYNNVIRKINATTGIIQTIAGTGAKGSVGDGGPAKNAEMNTPNGVALDSKGNIYISGYLDPRIRKLFLGITEQATTGQFTTGQVTTGQATTSSLLTSSSEATTGPFQAETTGESVSSSGTNPSGGINSGISSTTAGKKSSNTTPLIAGIVVGGRMIMKYVNCLTSSQVQWYWQHQ